MRTRTQLGSFRGKKSKKSRANANKTLHIGGLHLSAHSEAVAVAAAAAHTKFKALGAGNSNYNYKLPRGGIIHQIGGYTLLENLTHDANAYIYVTKCSTISLYFTNLFVT